jgi:nucleoprotein TPR
LQNDNEALLNERARLNTLMSNLQSMQNERERQENESRRRSLQETERLEQEVQTLKSRLLEEGEETKRISARREFESRDHQERIDKLNSELSSTRERLASATATRDQLQARVEEQGILLKSSEEKLLALSKPESMYGANAEQQLGVEIAELKKSLDLTKAELRDAKEYADKMKEISATAEDALQEMNNTHDAYKESMDQQLAEKDGEIKKLKERLEIVNSELQTSNHELSQIRQQEDERRHATEQENKSLQSEIARLKEVEEKAQLAQGFYQEDLRAQAHIAQEAQRNYERELVKHAEAAQNVQQLREEVGNLRTQVRSLRTEAETAVATLQSSEASWVGQKNDYERELREVRTRVDDLVKQNNILHQQFESVSSQAQQIRQRTESELTTLEADAAGQASPPLKEESMEALRDVIKYLRREKEIIDIKYEMLQQENRRLKQQLDRTTADLNETQGLLMTEREKEANAATSSLQHQELVAKINELNLLRESNITLRSENERNTQRAAELQATVTELTAKLSPLEEKVRLLQAEIETRDAQMRLLTEDNERWKNRNQQILQKYERIDPVELQNLKDQVEAANAEKAKLDSQLAEAISKNRAVAEAWKAKHDKAVASAKTRLDQNREIIESLEAKINASAKEAVNGNTQIEAIKAEAEAAKNELNRQITALQSQLETFAKTPPTVSASGSEWTEEKRSLEEAIKQKDAELARISALARGAERAKVHSLPHISDKQRETASRLESLEEEVKSLKAQGAAVAGSGDATLQPEFEQQVAAEVERRMSEIAHVGSDMKTDTNVEELLTTAGHAKERAVAEAVRATREAADARLAQVIAEKDKELAELRTNGEISDIEARIAEAVQAREMELNEIHERELKAAADAALKRFKQPTNEKINAAAIKHGERMFTERWQKFEEEQAAKTDAGGDDQVQEAVKKAIEETSRKKEEEFAEKVQKAAEGAKNEAEMRNKLQLGKLQKQVMEAKAKIDSYEKQFGQLAATVPTTSQQQPPGQPSPIAPQASQQAVNSGATPVRQQSTTGASMLHKLQAGRGGGIPRPGRGGNQQAGRGGGPGQGRGQRLSGQHPPQQQGQPQGQRPAVNRPVPANAGSPTTAPGQQRRQSAHQQSQLPRPAGGGLSAAAAPFQPGGIKRPRDDEGQGGQGAQAAGQKRTRVATDGENAANESDPS